MGQLPYWHSVELSAGSRSVLREKEIDVLVEDNIGLYQGKSKILKRQDGRVYLTTQRLIYIDKNDAATLSLSIELADIKYIEYSSKFLKSSPKIIIFFKMFKSNLAKTLQTAITEKITTWVCPICSFTNQVNVSLNYSSQSALPNCETCGIKANYELIKSVIDQFNKINKPIPLKQSKRKQIECSTCTFLNHPSLRNCEICGSNLPLNNSNSNILDKQEIFDDRIKIETESNDGLDESTIDFIKISFHKNGDKNFFIKFQEILEKYQWDKLVKNGNVNKAVVQISNHKIDDDALKLAKNDSLSFGIHTITQNENKQTVKNEQIINSSLDDLQTLLNKANEILELTESFQKLQELDGIYHQDTIRTITQDALYDSKKESQKKLYLEEVSRKISDFLINDGVLKQEGGIITLLDLYALYNRGRIGFNLISPDELYKACLMFEKLKLPLSLKSINNVLVVSTSEYGDLDKILKDIRQFIETFGDSEGSMFKFSNILKISEFFNWNVNITEEFLSIAIERGVLVIDQQIFGKHYYLNLFEEWEENFVTGDGNEYEGMVEISEPSVIEKDDQIRSSEIVQENHERSVTDFQFPTIPHRKLESKIEGNEQKVTKTMKQLEGLQF